MTRKRPRNRHRRSTTSDRERGSMSVEMLIVVPVLVFVILLIIGFGRLSYSRDEVTSAAGDAARAAVINLANPADAARSAARASLGQQGLACASVTVSTDTANLRPGGSIAVTVTCTARLSDVMAVGFPGHKSITARARAPIETHRTQS